jgi:hypothetical protein
MGYSGSDQQLCHYQRIRKTRRPHKATFLESHLRSQCVVVFMLFILFVVIRIYFVKFGRLQIWLESGLEGRGKASIRYEAFKNKSWDSLRWLGSSPKHLENWIDECSLVCWLHSGVVGDFMVIKLPKSLAARVGFRNNTPLFWQTSHHSQ